MANKRRTQLELFKSSQYTPSKTFQPEVIFASRSYTEYRNGTGDVNVQLSSVSSISSESMSLAAKPVGARPTYEHSQALRNGVLNIPRRCGV
jgi:hypothetical protein